MIAQDPGKATENTAEPDRCDVAVIGGGPAGLTAALALAQAGADVALVARKLPYGDNRTTALLGESVGLLQRLGVWERCEDSAAPLRIMRLVDDTGRLIRAPEVRFSSEEIGLDSFGSNIENRTLMTALEQRVPQFARIERIDDEAAAIAPTDVAVAVTTSSGRRIAAALVVGADGRNSASRKAAGIAMHKRPLPQMALTFNIAHSRPHNDTSTEFHTPQGPCVFVPLPGNRSSVVWVSAPKRAEQLMAMDDNALSAEAERQSHFILGRIRVEPGRHRFPLAIERPDRFGARRIVLIGEAAHVVPPIGAQGLNMGLRDAADIADIVQETLSADGDPGAAAAISRFEAARRTDVSSRILAIDAANRSLLNGMLPLQALRALGLHAIRASGPLRRFAMREGLALSWRAPAAPAIDSSEEAGLGSAPGS